MCIYLITGLLRLPLRSFLLPPSSQVDQLRSELMQERSARHDLEMDKSALERQVMFIHPVKAGAHRFIPTQCRTAFSFWQNH